VCLCVFGCASLTARSLARPSHAPQLVMVIIGAVLYAAYLTLNVSIATNNHYLVGGFVLLMVLAMYVQR